MMVLTQLKRTRTCSQEPDVVDLLLECHERIRHFTRLAAWLADAHDAPALSVQETARDVHRYFTVALPLHSADEDLSIAPRLLKLRLPEELEVATAAMTGQHETIEATLSALAPMWAAVAEDSSRLVRLAAAMEKSVDKLQSLWLTHLHLEETMVFPAVRGRLSPGDQARILQEMRDRRRPEP